MFPLCEAFGHYLSLYKLATHDCALPIFETVTIDLSGINKRAIDIKQIFPISLVGKHIYTTRHCNKSKFLSTKSIIISKLILCLSDSIKSWPDNFGYSKDQQFSHHLFQIPL